MARPDYHLVSRNLVGPADRADGNDGPDDWTLASKGLGLKFGAACLAVIAFLAICGHYLSSAQLG